MQFKLTKKLVAKLEKSLQELINEYITVDINKSKITFIDNVVDNVKLALHYNYPSNVGTITEYEEKLIDFTYQDRECFKENELTAEDVKDIFLYGLAGDEVEIFGYKFCFDYTISSNKYETITIPKETNVDYDDIRINQEGCRLNLYNYHANITRIYDYDDNMKNELSYNNEDFWDYASMLYKELKVQIEDEADKLDLLVFNYKLKHWAIGYKPKVEENMLKYSGHDYICCIRLLDDEFKRKEKYMLDYIKGIAEIVFTGAYEDVLHDIRKEFLELMKNNKSFINFKYIDFILEDYEKHFI